MTKLTEMKRISLLTILIFITGIMISCNDSSSGNDITKGYIDPALTTAKDIAAAKTYDIASFGGAYSGAGEACLAIIYQGELNGTPYVGIAVKNGSYNLKIYWSASSLPAIGSGITLSSSCTVVFNNGTTVVTYPGVNIVADVSTSTSGTSGTLTMYTIDFTTVTGAATGIASGDSITAVKI